MCGSTARTQRMVVHRLLSMVACRLSSVCSRVGRITPPPALFTRTSTWPEFARSRRSSEILGHAGLLELADEAAGDRGLRSATRSQILL